MTACDGNVHHPVGPVRVTDPVQITEAAPQDGALASAASLITKELSGDPNFGSVALEQGKLVVMWHGAESDRISRLRDQLPGVGISIRSAACVPGTAMDRAGILLTEDARVRVVEMSKDGSHVVVTVSEGADNSALAAAYEAQLGCPVRLGRRGPGHGEMTTGALHALTCGFIGQADALKCFVGTLILGVCRAC